MVVVLAGRGSSRGQEAWEAEARRLADGLGWAVEKRSYDASGPRTGEHALSSGRSQDLYELVHNQESSVISFVKGSATVRANKLIPLGRFLRYKSAYRVVSDVNGLAEAFRSVDADSANVDLACADSNDPRVLPLHLFAPKQDFQNLDSPKGRKSFRLAYRNQGSYRDSDRRPWQVPHPDEMHGNDVLSIRSFVLEPGFHWDVQGSNRDTTIRTPARDFKIPKLGYANVRPNGRVALGSA